MDFGLARQVTEQAGAASGAPRAERAAASRLPATVAAPALPPTTR